MHALCQGKKEFGFTSTGGRITVLPIDPPAPIMSNQNRSFKSPLLSKAPWVVISVAALVLALPHVDAQQADGATAPAAPIVKEIVVQYDGQESVPRERILANMATKVGDRLDNTGSEDIRSLYASGVVENVQTSYEKVAGGVRLIVRVKTLGALGKLEFMGNSQVDDDRLARAVGMSIGDSVEDTQFQEGRTAILEVYRDSGFPDVKVSYRTGEMPGNRTAVTFSIDEGQQSYLRKVIFEGNTVFKERELRKQMSTRRRGIFSFLTSSGKIDNDQLEKDIDAVAAHYRNAGYLNADVVSVERQRVNDDTVDLVIKIVEGDLYTVGSVGVQGMTIFSESEVVPSFEVVTGEYYSAAKIKEDVQMLRDFYGSQGYGDIRVRPRVDPDASRSLNIVYAIDEGEKSFISKIEIGGNTKTKDKVIRRELAVAPGDSYNTVLIDVSRNRLEGLLYFSEVSILPVESGQDGYKDLNIQVTETSTGSVNVGAGFSSIDNLVGFLDLEQTNFDIMAPPNFTGGGQKFRMSLKVGSERRDFQVSLVEPWFLDRRLSLGGDLFYEDRFFLSDEYDQRNIGGNLFLRKPIGEHAFLKGEYKLQEVQISDIDDEASPEIQAEEGDFLQSQLGFSFVHDTRDSFTLPREGHKIEAGASFSGGFLGGDVDVYGVNLGAAQHFLLPGDTILTIAGRLNVTDGWDSGDQVPIFERNFLGGANNLRGFDYRDVGPKDATGEPLGGGTSGYVTLEYTAPVMDWIRAAVFYDAGFVNEDAFDYSTSDYNSNYGIGVRLFVPKIGMIRLDYGIPMESDAFNDSSGRFNFNLGYRF